MAVFLSSFFYLNIFLFSCTFTLTNTQTNIYENDEPKFIVLKPNEQVKSDSTKLFSIYCFHGANKSFLQVWRSVTLFLENPPKSYDVVTGENATIVDKKYKDKSMWNPSSWLTGQKGPIEFPAFSNYCVGLSTKESYSIFLKVRVINYWKVLQTIIGILLFLCAPSLSRNIFFHYTSGVSLGVVASFLILIFVISRLIPKKQASYAVMIFGYSFCLYMIQVFWDQLNTIVSNYMDYLLVYCLVTSVISFFVCYRLGPVQNVRTFNIIQWCMQIIGVILIYLSSEYREVSTAVIIILITTQIIPASWISKFQRLWYRLFPPKVKLLTELEYIEQGSKETAKALGELRDFCSSPDCNTWKMVRQLKDPIRFSKFVETGSHYTDEELLRYNSEGFDDDDDIESETDLSNNLSNGSATTSRDYSLRRS